MQNWEDDSFKSKVGNGSFHQDNNDNGVKILNFAVSKNLVKSTIFPY